MGFMQRQVTRKMDWLEIDGAQGTTFVAAEDVPDLLEAYQNYLTATEEDSPEFEAMIEIAQQYYDGEPQTVELRTGHGVRLSAPGYMDCTDWSVFDTVAEAEAYLDEMYGDEEDEDEDENDCA